MAQTGASVHDALAARRFDRPSSDDQAVISLLAGLPIVPMPDDVVARLEGRLLAERPLQPPVEAAEPAERALSSVTPSEPTPQRWMERWSVPISIAASIVLVLSLSAVVLRAAGVTFVVEQGPVYATGTDYSNGSLSRAVPRLLSNAGLAYVDSPTVSAPSPAQPSQITGSFAADPERLRSCVEGIVAEPAASIVAVDVATYRGVPAGVVVTRIPGRSGIEITVVPLGCSADQPALIDQVEIIDG